MINNKLFTVCLSMLVLSGCDQSDKAISDVVHNMVFVQGGTFEMGGICLKQYG